MFINGLRWDMDAKEGEDVLVLVIVNPPRAGLSFFAKRVLPLGGLKIVGLAMPAPMGFWMGKTYGGDGGGGGYVGTL
jgi:hypothetical protein